MAIGLSVSGATNKISNEEMEFLSSEITEMVEDWYFGVNIPELGTMSFERFVTKTHGTLVWDMLRTKTTKIKFVAGSDGYTDLTDIFIPAPLLDARFFMEVYGIHEEYANSALSIALINGIKVHESGHIRCTMYNPSDSLRMIYNNDVKDCEILHNKANENAFHNINNIVEDAYIDGDAFKNFPRESRFLKALLAVFFTKYEFVKRYHHVKQAIANDNATIGDYINLLVFLRTELDDEQYDMAVEIFGQGIFSDVIAVVEGAETNTYQRQELRIAHSFKILLELLERIKENEEEDDEKEDDADGEGDDEGEGEENSASGDEDKKDDEKEGDGDDNKSDDKPDNEDDFNSSLEKYLDELSEELKNMAERLNDASDDQQEKQLHDDLMNDYRDLERKDKDDDFVRYEDILEVTKKRDYKYMPDKDYYVLGKFLARKRTTKSNRGIPQNKGVGIDPANLHRIVTDSKIMRKPTIRSRTYGKPEVIILLDVSGSTDNYYDKRGNHVWGSSNGKVLRHSIVEAGLGSHISLRNANIPNSVYTHTTSSSYKSYINGVAAYNMPMNGEDYKISTGDLNERFERIESIDFWGNADGAAIEFVSKRFSRDETQKIIIILSDGQPSECPYGRASDHLKYIIHKCRKSGIGVFSMSVVNGVADANDELYGTLFNIKAFGEDIKRGMLQFTKSAGLGEF